MSFKTVKFDRPTYQQSIGRNGHVGTIGIEIYDRSAAIPDHDYQEIHIHPITTRGETSEKCRIVVRKTALPALIAALQEIGTGDNSGRLLLDIQELMDGVEWTDATLESIAEKMENGGYPIRDADGERVTAEDRRRSIIEKI